MKIIFFEPGIQNFYQAFVASHSCTVTILLSKFPVLPAYILNLALMPATRNLRIEIKPLSL